MQEIDQGQKANGVVEVKAIGDLAKEWDGFEEQEFRNPMGWERQKDKNDHTEQGGPIANFTYVSKRIEQLPGPGITKYGCQEQAGFISGFDISRERNQGCSMFSQ